VTGLTPTAGACPSPPTDLEAEKCLLGSLIKEPDYIHRVGNIVNIGDFSDYGHRRLYSNMLRLSCDGDPITRETLQDLDYDTTIQDVLENYVSSSKACVYYARRVREVAWERRVFAFGLVLQRSSLEDGDTKAILSEGYEDLIEYGSVENDVYEPSQIADICDEIQRKCLNPGIHGIRTLFPIFDSVVKGLKTVNLVTATTGFGKTALALQWAYNIGIIQGIPTLYINYEMEVSELTERLLACSSGVFLDKIQTGAYNGPDVESVGKSSGLLAGGKLHVTGCQAKTIDHTLNLIHQYKRLHGIQVVFIDYIGEVSPRDGELERGTYTTYGDWVQRIKDVCNRLTVKSVVLSQVNRSGYNDLPGVENIAGSMQLPQKANVFVSLCATKEGLTVLKIDKNRGGAIPEPIPISFNRKCQQITELSNGQPPF